MGSTSGTTGEHSRRMLKKSVQQGRSERRGEAYASVRRASERCENAAGGLFQHPATHPVADNARSGRIQPTHPAPLDAGPAQDRGIRRDLAM